MTRPKYAPVTSKLLVRKGEARPWSLDEAKEAPFPGASASRDKRARRPASAECSRFGQTDDELEWNPPRVAPSGAEAGEHPKRCSVKLSHAEYERLGIIAAKKEVSRQQILHQALQHYLGAARREFGCACLGACDGTC